MRLQLVTVRSETLVHRPNDLIDLGLVRANGGVHQFRQEPQQDFVVSKA